MNSFYSGDDDNDMFRRLRRILLAHKEWNDTTRTSDRSEPALAASTTCERDSGTRLLYFRLF